MEKNIIKILLREGLLDKLKGLSEVGKTPDNTKTKKKSDSNSENTGESEDEVNSKEKKDLQTKTIEIRQAVGPGKSLKISQAIEDAGLGDANDAAARGKYTQKIFGRNDRHLSPKEAAALSKVTKNPNAFK